jgi:hypothetical protein
VLCGSGIVCGSCGGKPPTPPPPEHYVVDATLRLRIEVLAVNESGGPVKNAEVTFVDVGLSEKRRGRRLLIGRTDATGVLERDFDYAWSYTDYGRGPTEQQSFSLDIRDERGQMVSRTFVLSDLPIAPDDSLRKRRLEWRPTIRAER